MIQEENKYFLSKARANLTDLFNKALLGKTVELIKRGSGSSVLLVPETLKPLTDCEAGYTNKLSVMIATHLLPHADQSFIKAQIEDFLTLNIQQLICLLKVEKLPLIKNLRGEIVQAIGGGVVERLEQRYNLSEAIKSAEDKGLYETAEHLSNNFSW